MNEYQESLVILKKIEEEHNKKVIGISNSPVADVLQELVDKATPKKPTFLNYGGYKIGNWHCPHCNKIIIIDNRKASLPKHCDDCDQLLDWSEENE